jgi:dihydropteroate synthase
MLSRLPTSWKVAHHALLSHHQQLSLVTLPVRLDLLPGLPQPLHSEVSKQTLPATWRCGRFLFDLSKRQRPLVMGILNATPDSFSDGGKFRTSSDAIAQAERMIANGADLIDIGGESTRPGAEPVSLQEELDRVLPVIEALKNCGVALSIDTYKAETMRQALHAGVDCVNDIWALRQDGAVEAIIESDQCNPKNQCGIVLMHMQRDPQTMQFDPEYQDVIAEVKQFLQERAQLLQEKGIAQNRIAIDPGFGFGKSLEHNLKMLADFDQFSQLAYLVLAGMSRKSMLGKLTGRDTNDRVAPSVAAAILAADRGARIIRVHDVQETVDSLKLWEAIQE